ncbi:MAG: hypothetical protein ACHRHE_19620 [Tepidisphaerales bacterium]
MSAKRRLFLCAVLALLIGSGIAIVYAINFNYDAAAIVMTVSGSGFAILTTIALFMPRRPSSPAEKTLADAATSAREIVNRANQEAAKLLAEAADKAMALSSLDCGKCKHCGNPRTGKFCPKCGRAAEA